MDPLSPELVLVDPVLAADARRRLPDPPDCLAVRPLETAVERTGTDVAVVARHVRRTWTSGGSDATPLGPSLPHTSMGAVRLTAPSMASARRRAVAAVPAPVVVEETRRARPSLLAIVVVLLVALGIGLPSFNLLPWGSAELPSFVGDGRGGETIVEARGDGLVLEWPEVDGATVYDVVLWRGGRRMLDLWPQTNRLDVRTAAAKAGKRLAPGTYQWFAFAGFGSRDDLRFGEPLANGTFTVE